MGIFNQNAVLESLDYNRKNETNEESFDLDSYETNLESWEYSDIKYQGERANAALDEAVNAWFKEIGINELAFAEAFHEEINYESVVTEGEDGEEGDGEGEAAQDDQKAEETKSANEENGGKFKAMLSAIKKTIKGIVDKVIAKLKEIGSKVANRAKSVVAAFKGITMKKETFNEKVWPKVKDMKFKWWPGLGDIREDFKTSYNEITDNIVLACLGAKVVANEDDLDKETKVAARYVDNIKRAEAKGSGDPAKTVYRLFFDPKGVGPSGIPYNDTSSKEAGATAAKLSDSKELTFAEIFGDNPATADANLAVNLNALAGGNFNRAAARVNKAKNAVDKAIAGVEAKIAKGHKNTEFLTSVVSRLKPFVTEFNSAATAFASATSGKTNEILRAANAVITAAGKKSESKDEEPAEKKEEDKKGGEEETKEESYSFLDALNGLI